MEQYMALHKVIVNNNTSQCLGSASDGVLPSDLDTSIWSLQNYNYDDPETQIAPIDYRQWDTIAMINMYFVDDELTLDNP
jgi:hypothetical protein